MKLIKSLALVISLATLGACTQSAKSIESYANRSSTSWSMGKPYTQVAALGKGALSSLSTEQVGYGPMIGSYALANGDRVYRHIAPASEANSSTSFGIIGSSSVQTNYRLSYFKVGANGIVNDWATGSAPGSISDCTTYLGGIIRQCEDASRVKLTHAAYDARVRTSQNQPISVWGQAVE